MDLFETLAQAMNPDNNRELLNEIDINNHICEDNIEFIEVGDIESGPMLEGYCSICGKRYL